MEGTTQAPLTTELDEFAQEVRKAYIDDIYGLRGTEDAYFETAERQVKRLIPFLADALGFIARLHTAGYGLVVPESEDQMHLLPTLEQTQSQGDSFRPLSLLDFVRGVVRAHIWYQLKDEIRPIREERGETQ